MRRGVELGLEHEMSKIRSRKRLTGIHIVGLGPGFRLDGPRLQRLSATGFVKALSIRLFKSMTRVKQKYSSVFGDVSKIR